jgi:prophage regulatory protein
MVDKIWRLPAVLLAVGLSRSSIYTRMTQRLFPKPVSLGGRAVGWPESEVAALIAARIAGDSDAKIRNLVARLEAARRTNAERGREKSL